MESVFEIKSAADPKMKSDNTLLKPEHSTAIKITEKLTNIIENKEKFPAIVTGQENTHEELHERVRKGNNEICKNNGNNNNSVENKNKSTSDDKITPKFRIISVYKSYEPGNSRCVNIKDPIFLLPFKYGWKRLVINRSVITSKKCDVFYSPPMSNSRLRSKKAIQKLLISLNNHTLTTKNFTFIDDHIGVNDPDKEIIRYARTKK